MNDLAQVLERVKRLGASATADDMEAILQTPEGQLALEEFSGPRSPRAVRILHNSRPLLTLKREACSCVEKDLGEQIDIFLSDFDDEKETQIFLKSLRELRRLRGTIDFEKQSPADMKDFVRFKALLKETALMMRRLSESQ